MSIEDAIGMMRAADPIVWLVTSQVGPTADGARRGGLLATWVHETSLDDTRPRMLLSLAPHHFTTELIRESGQCVLHQIAESDLHAYWVFCLASGHDVDKFRELVVHDDGYGQPRLDRCVGYLSCRVVAEVDTGDRILLWADVIGGERIASGEPLRQSRLIQLASDDQRQKLRENREQDAQRLRPLFDRWQESQGRR